MNDIYQTKENSIRRIRPTDPFLIEILFTRCPVREMGGGSEGTVNFIFSFPSSYVSPSLWRPLMIELKSKDFGVGFQDLYLFLET